MKMIGRFPNILSFGNERSDMVMIDIVLGKHKSCLLICIVNKKSQRLTYCVLIYGPLIMEI